PGRDFTMSQTTVTIPAGESAATFPFQVNFTHLIPDSAVIVYLQLLDNEAADIKAGVNIGHFELTMIGKEKE
ncbi:MAG TPA: hypothetical protein VK106_05675, partial [Balneolaceae bacterium]|nr:hypothetical protein [Balneolaceae bacterium]